MGYRKGYSSQHSLISVLEKWRGNLDKGGKYCALFVDISKAFDSLPHNFLYAMLNAYGFGYEITKLILSFLRNRKYRTKDSMCLSK